ncbi:DUF5659 domain-containing protein [Clostridium beijerinckii]|jgi:hypothetical protein|uniref:DUF5659 domain-containing protein n=1 Tax=Clostridium beijerinckii TaxID=1520 RepID=A0A1S8RP31_CLOBE|nr:DUF5659 domain-containing protein [Clostridium beijerinckii]MBF7811563.1 hypothetical protein [Clostridium beijerinckii]MBF7811946.1 hypothetical protein [Clostridium beijerinckii]NOW07212.1 hypothetical protein [Clostridium beijerinckii]NRT25203.1 hypothetical protein [Clostridium beijerinckii]NRT67203.1 hypothetical protein [Clostridium beijerinckii]
MENVPLVKFVRTQKLAGYLMLQGFKFLRDDIDRNNPNYKIYIFKNQDGIETAIDNYKKEFGRKGN